MRIIVLIQKHDCLGKIILRMNLRSYHKRRQCKVNNVTDYSCGKKRNDISLKLILFRIQ